MALIAETRRERSRADASSTGEAPGLYLRPERRSGAQFAPVWLGTSSATARQMIDSVLERLFTKHGETKLNWYIERSLGLDVEGRIAWCNLDLTDQVVP